MCRRDALVRRRQIEHVLAAAFIAPLMCGCLGELLCALAISGCASACFSANKVAIKTVSAARSRTDNAVEKQGGVEGRPAEDNHRLFDSQIESFCRCLRTSGCRVCYHHSERDRTALGWRSRQNARTG
jgi:hypothetical protein